MTEVRGRFMPIPEFYNGTTMFTCSQCGCTKATREAFDALERCQR